MYKQDSECNVLQCYVSHYNNIISALGNNHTIITKYYQGLIEPRKRLTWFDKPLVLMEIHLHVGYSTDLECETIFSRSHSYMCMYMYMYM